MIKATDARAKLADGYIADDTTGYAELNALVDLAITDRKSSTKVIYLPLGAKFVLERFGYRVTGPITIGDHEPFYRIDWS